MSRKPCATCGKLIPVNQTRCYECEKKLGPAKRPKTTARGYGHAWRQIRDAVLREEPYCQCGARANTVDHVIPRSKGGTDARSNLRAICASCHSRKTAGKDGGFGN